MPLRKISAEAFARRLKETTAEADKRFALFLGAGCSVSSGIPTAGSLVREDWLRRLHRYDAPEQEFDAWLQGVFPDYDVANAAGSYGTVMERLFLQPEERQREVERLCDGRFPGFGYAALASLIAMEGGAFNVVLTTNFDDLVADALYLFTRARPLVIHHESLAGFIRSTRTRPLLVKLHGDNRLAPRNTLEETSSIGAIQRQVASLLHDRGLIFMGYSGNDRGIAETMAALSEDALPLGVYWINGEEPQGALADWLAKRNAIWIEKADFDEFMLLVRDAFELPHPEQRRFDEVFEKYKATYEELSQRVLALGNAVPGATALKAAVKRTDASFPDWYAVQLEASRHRYLDPELADAIYSRGLEQFPSSAPLLGSYAVFLKNIRKDYDRAEEYYKLSLTIAPSQPDLLANYATFLADIRRDASRAEELFHKALGTSSTNAVILARYATFLHNVKRDYAQAETFYERALLADSSDAFCFGNYASFLKDVRKDFAQAEKFFRRALELEPTSANRLANLSGFLLGIARTQEGLKLLQRAFQESADAPKPVIVELLFYRLVHDSKEVRRETLASLKKLLREGIRSPYWDFSLNITQAKPAGDPDIRWLKMLANVISEDGDLSLLDGWPEWEAA